MSKKVKKLFNCPQDALYAVILIATGNARKFLAQFTAFKAFYTADYFDILDKKVQEAENMLNEKQRNANSSIRRDDAEVSANSALKQWRRLRQYISSAYKGNVQKARLNEAGMASYAEASQMNWGAVKSILKMGSDFVTANKAALMANNNMPPEFVAIYTDAASACQLLIKDFRDTSLGKGSQTIDKNQADNELYTPTISFLKDGQIIFEEDKSAQRLYVFNTLLKTVKSKMPAHFSGYALDENKRPIADAVISINNGQYTAVTNKKGRFDFNRVEASTYPVSVQRPGFHIIEEEITFKPGTGKHIKFTLIPDMQVVKSSTELEKVA